MAGLLFEGFGPVGEKRSNDLGGRPVDTTAELPGGFHAIGVTDLQAYLKQSRRDEFVDNFVRKMLSYGLGRSLILSDDLLVQELKEKLSRTDYRIGTLIKGIVESPQFRRVRGVNGKK